MFDYFDEEQNERLLGRESKLRIEMKQASDRLNGPIILVRTR